MAGKFHVNTVTGEYSPCTANKVPCPIGGVESHYTVSYTHLTLPTTPYV